MKKVMLKLLFTLPVVMLTVFACSGDALNLLRREDSKINEPIINFDGKGYANYSGMRFKLDKNNKLHYYGTRSEYGAFLAGRVAYMRHDMEEAVEYYKIVLEKNPENRIINLSTYLLMASFGDFDEAAPYAQAELDTKKYGVMAPLIVAVTDLKHKNYAKVHETLNLENDKIYVSLIYPFIDAWAYAGENNKEKAFAIINKIEEKDSNLIVMKLFHRALLNEYFGNKKEAQADFEKILNKYASEMNFRRLEVIADFYIRNGEQEKASTMLKKFVDNSAFSFVLSDIEKFINENKPNPDVVIDTPQKAVADAMFSFNVLFRLARMDNTFALIFDAISIYLNPDYDATKISMANVLEDMGYLQAANKYYLQINPDSGYAYLAQFRYGLNLYKTKRTREAVEVFEKMLKQRPDDVDVLINLADIMSETDNVPQAIKFYERAINSPKFLIAKGWPVYYSLGAAYAKVKQADKSQENMLKALELSNRDAVVLNYVGYDWLEKDKNTDEAVKMVVEAYNKYPLDGHIVDSLGWVFFRMGNYEKAVEYLSQASDMNPANAVISDHLGDAYWMQGRKNEAVFQWKHALSQKEDTELLDKNVIRAKINNGLPKPVIIAVEDPEILETLNAF